MARAKRGKEKDLAAAPTQDPIIITGGSVKLEYADKTVDGFETDITANGKTRVKHKRNSSGKAELTRIEIYHPRTGTAPVQTISLKDLGINRNCRIEVHYDFE